MGRFTRNSQGQTVYIPVDAAPIETINPTSLSDLASPISGMGVVDDIEVEQPVIYDRENLQFENLMLTEEENERMRQLERDRRALQNLGIDVPDRPVMQVQPGRPQNTATGRVADYNRDQKQAAARQRILHETDSRRRKELERHQQKKSRKSTILDSPEARAELEKVRQGVSTEEDFKEWWYEQQDENNAHAWDVNVEGDAYQELWARINQDSTLAKKAGEFLGKTVEDPDRTTAGSEVRDEFYAELEQEHNQRELEKESRLENRHMPGHSAPREYTPKPFDPYSRKSREESKDRMGQVIVSNRVEEQVSNLEQLTEDLANAEIARSEASTGFGPGSMFGTSELVHEEDLIIKSNQAQREWRKLQDQIYKHLNDPFLSDKTKRHFVSLLQKSGRRLVESNVNSRYEIRLKEKANTLSETDYWKNLERRKGRKLSDEERIQYLRDTETPMELFLEEQTHKQLSKQRKAAALKSIQNSPAFKILSPLGSTDTGFQVLLAVSDGITGLLKIPVSVGAAAGVPGFTKFGSEFSDFLEDHANAVDIYTKDTLGDGRSLKTLGLHPHQFRSVVTSIYQSMVLGGMGLGSGGVATGFGLTSFADEYQRGIDEGLSRGTASLYAGIQGVLEGGIEAALPGTNKWAVNLMTRGVLKKTAKDGLKIVAPTIKKRFYDFAKTVSEEQASEALTTITQLFAEGSFIHEDENFFSENIGPALLETVETVFAQTILMGGGGNLVSGRSRRLKHKYNERMWRHQQRLDAVYKKMEGLKTSVRSSGAVSKRIAEAINRISPFGAAHLRRMREQGEKISRKTIEKLYGPEVASVLGRADQREKFADALLGQKRQAHQEVINKSPVTQKSPVKTVEVENQQTGERSVVNVNVEEGQTAQEAVDEKIRTSTGESPVVVNEPATESPSQSDEWIHYETTGEVLPQAIDRIANKIANGQKLTDVEKDMRGAAEEEIDARVLEIEPAPVTQETPTEAPAESDLDTVGAQLPPEARAKIDDYIKQGKIGTQISDLIASISKNMGVDLEILEKYQKLAEDKSVKEYLARQAEKGPAQPTPTETATETDPAGSDSREWTPGQEKEKTDYALGVASKRAGKKVKPVNAKSETGRRIQKFAESLGIKLVFLKDSDMPGARGIAVKKDGEQTGVIFLRQSLEGEGLLRIAAHEIAHGIGADKVDIGLTGQEKADLIEEYLSTGTAEQRAEFEALFEANPEKAEREAIAVLAEKLIRDGSFRNRMLQENPSLVAKIVEAIRKFLVKHPEAQLSASEIKLMSLFDERLAETPTEAAPEQRPAPFSKEGIALRLSEIDAEIEEAGAAFPLGVREQVDDFFANVSDRRGREWQLESTAKNMGLDLRLFEDYRSLVEEKETLELMVREGMFTPTPAKTTPESAPETTSKFSPEGKLPADVAKELGKLIESATTKQDKKSVLDQWSRFNVEAKQSIFASFTESQKQQLYEIEIDAKTIPQLKAQLKEMGAKGYSGKNKAGLIKMILEAPAEATPTQETEWDPVKDFRKFIDEKVERENDPNLQSGSKLRKLAKNERLTKFEDLSDSEIRARILEVRALKKGKDNWMLSATLGTLEGRYKRWLSAADVAKLLGMTVAEIHNLADAGRAGQGHLQGFWDGQTLKFRADTIYDDVMVKIESKQERDVDLSPAEQEVASVPADPSTFEVGTAASPDASLPQYNPPRMTAEQHAELKRFAENKKNNSQDVVDKYDEIMGTTPAEKEARRQQAFVLWASGSRTQRAYAKAGGDADWVAKLTYKDRDGKTVETPGIRIDFGGVSKRSGEALFIGRNDADVLRDAFVQGSDENANLPKALDKLFPGAGFTRALVSKNRSVGAYVGTRQLSAEEKASKAVEAQKRAEARKKEAAKKSLPPRKATPPPRTPPPRTPPPRTPPPLRKGPPPLTKRPPPLDDVDLSPAESDESVVSLKNASVNADFIAAGLAPPTKAAQMDFQNEIDEAAKYDEDDVQDVIQKYLNDPNQPPQVRDEAVILLHYQKLRDNPNSDPAKLEEIGQLIDFLGTQSARSLAFRRMWLSQDYSLDGMRRQVDAVLKGKRKLSAEETAKLEEKSAKYEKKKKRAEELQKTKRNIESNARFEDTVDDVIDTNKTGKKKTKSRKKKPKQKDLSVTVDGRELNKELLMGLSKEELLGIAAKLLPENYTKVENESWRAEYLSTYSKQDFVREILSTAEATEQSEAQAKKPTRSFQRRRELEDLVATLDDEDFMLSPAKDNRKPFSEKLAGIIQGTAEDEGISLEDAAKQTLADILKMSDPSKHDVIKKAHAKAKKILEGVGKKEEIVPEELTNEQTVEELKSNLSKIVKADEQENLNGNKKTAYHRIARQLLEHFVGTERQDAEQALNSIYEVFEDALPGEFTKDRVRELACDYGIWQALPEDPAKKAIRNARGLLRQLSKIHDMREKGEQPKKSGVEQHTPETEERQLIKIVNRLKKNITLDDLDPEKSAKSALESLKTRLRNEIEDIQNALDNDNPLNKERTPVERDAEAKELEKLKQEKIAAYNEAFPKEIDEKAERERRLVNRIKHEDKRIDELEQAIEKNQPIERSKESPPMSEELAKRQEKRRKLVEKYNELFPPPKVELTKQQKLERREQAAERTINALRNALQNGERIKRSEVDETMVSAALREMQAEIKMLREAYDRRFPPVKRKTDRAKQEQARIKAAEESIAAMRAALDSDTPIPKAPKMATSPVLEKIIQRRERIRREYRKRFPRKPRAVTEEQRIALAEAALRKSIQRVKRRIRTKDINPLVRVFVRTPMLDAMRAEKELLDKELREMRRLATALSPKEKAKRRRMAALLTKKKQMKADLIAGQRTKRKNSPEYDKTDKDIIALENEIADITRDYVETFGLDMAVDRTVTGILRQIKEYRNRIAEGRITADRRSNKEVEAHKNVVQARKDLLDAQRDFARFKDDILWERMNVVEKGTRVTVDTWDGLKTLKASYDLSGFRQALTASLARPLLAIKAGSKMFQAVVSEEKRLEIEDQLVNDKYYSEAKAAGISFNQRNGVLSAQEEGYMSRWIDRYSDEGLGTWKALIDPRAGLAASERAFSTLLNTMRMEYYKDLTVGQDLSKSEKEHLAGFVNAMTGRGNLTKSDAWLVGLNRFIWAPRLLMSRVQILSGHHMLAGTYYGKGKDFNRRRMQAIVGKEYLRMFRPILAIAALAWMSMDDDEWEDFTDPRGAKFGCIKIGGVYLDWMGGFKPVIRLVAQQAAFAVPDSVWSFLGLEEGDVRTFDGEVKHFGDDIFTTRGGALWNFARNKFHPSAGLTWSLLVEGSDVVGRPMTPTRAAFEAVAPLWPASFTAGVLSEFKKEGLPAAGARALIELPGAFLTNTLAPDELSNYESIVGEIPDPNKKSPAQKIREKARKKATPKKITAESIREKARREAMSK